MPRVFIIQLGVIGESMQNTTLCRRAFLTSTATLGALALGACAKGTSQDAAQDTSAKTTEPTALLVFAAASLTESLNKISEQYQSVEPDVSVLFNLDSSGTLATQIQEGASADLFISAGKKQMDKLQNAEGGSLIQDDTRKDLLHNSLVLCAASDKAQFSSWEEFALALSNKEFVLSMGNGDVPAGQYGSKLLSALGLNEEELQAAGVISYATNVKEVMSQVSAQSVDAGLVYKSDAIAEGMTAVLEATSEQVGEIVYPAAVIASAVSNDAAHVFLDYLRQSDAQAVFESFGFSAA